MEDEAKTFSYVLISADTSIALEQRSGDATKAVTDFADDIRADLVPKEGDPSAMLQKQVAAGEIPPELLAQLDVFALSGSSEILALTIPTAGNQSTSVSMYHNLHATEANPRATQLARSCGHARAEVRGNAMISRIIDNEKADVWKRVDITVEEATPDSQWVVDCARKGMGGGHGGAGSSVAASLAGMSGPGQAGGQAVQQLAQGMKAHKMKAKPNEKCPCGSGTKFKKCHGSYT